MEWGESCLVHIAHFLGLRIYAGSFENTSREKWCAAFFKADTYWDWVQPSGA
jgi:hypothetical protein